MWKKIIFAIIALSSPQILFGQQIGIGTTAPDTNAILDIQSTSQGILFPRLTTLQRDAILNPPDGLHIFNTEDHCLNFYDAVLQIWNCYCAACEYVYIKISSNICGLDFYNYYGVNQPSRNYLVEIDSGVVLSGCAGSQTALDLSTMPGNCSFTIINHGTIRGSGGAGGSGQINQGCSVFEVQALQGDIGGDAIKTRTGIFVLVKNDGVIAGGGGGGGGSGRGIGGIGIGGGGGGGAGNVPGIGGIGGGQYQFAPFIGVCLPVSNLAGSGAPGMNTIGGAGGLAIGGGSNGGMGGGPGMNGLAGFNGTFSIAGGLAGKAIAGGSGNAIVNIGSGAVFGAID